MRGHGTWEQLSADRPRCTRTMFLEVFKSRMPVPVPGSRNDRVAHLLYNRYAPPCQFLKTKSLLCSVAAHTFEIRLCRYELRCIILPGTSYQFEVCDYESNSLPAHSLNHTHILREIENRRAPNLPKLVSSSNTLPVPVNSLYFSTPHIDHRRNVAPLRDVPRLARGCHSVSLIGEDAELTLVWPSVSRGC